MVKYLSLKPVWAATLVVIFLSGPGRLIEKTDPMDDFSYSLGSSPNIDSYRLITLHKVTDILSRRLDLFPQSQIPSLSHHIFSLCKRYRFDPAFILSLIEVESNFRVKVVSPAGAIGLMQVMLPTANFVARNLDFHFSDFENFKGNFPENRRLTSQMLMDPFVNTAIGIAYLNFLRDYYKGLSPYYVLGAYNMGPARLDELLMQKSFKGTETIKYSHSIRRGMLAIRYDQPAKAPLSAVKGAPLRL